MRCLFITLIILQLFVLSKSEDGGEPYLDQPPCEVTDLDIVKSPILRIGIENPLSSPQILHEIWDLCSSSLPVEAAVAAVSEIRQKTGSDLSHCLKTYDIKRLAHSLLKIPKSIAIDDSLITLCLDSTAPSLIGSASPSFSANNNNDDDNAKCLSLRNQAMTIVVDIASSGPRALISIEQTLSELQSVLDSECLNLSEEEDFENLKMASFQEEQVNASLSEEEDFEIIDEIDEEFYTDEDLEEEEEPIHDPPPSNHHHHEHHTHHEHSPLLPKSSLFDKTENSFFDEVTSKVGKDLGDNVVNELEEILSSIFEFDSLKKMPKVLGNAGYGVLLSAKDLRRIKALEPLTNTADLIYPDFNSITDVSIGRCKDEMIRGSIHAFAEKFNFSETALRKPIARHLWRHLMTPEKNFSLVASRLNEICKEGKVEGTAAEALAHRSLIAAAELDVQTPRFKEGNAIFEVTLKKIQE